MLQLTQATANFDKPRRVTRRAVFLAEMVTIIPWQEPFALIEPFYPKPSVVQSDTGNARVRRGMIQFAWRFLHFQKDSALAHGQFRRSPAGYRVAAAGMTGAAGRRANIQISVSIMLLA
jgi:hypothetical protein